MTAMNHAQFLEASRRTRAFQDFVRENADLINSLYDIRSWNSFASSLLSQAEAGRIWSDRQISSAEDMVFKIETKKAEEALAAAEEAQQEGPAVSLRPSYPKLAETFLRAADALRWPKLRLSTESGDPVVLSLAGPNSRNAGHINVTDGGGYGVGTFFGTITPNGESRLNNRAGAEVLAVLAAYNADPAAEGKVQGLRTGRCMCCGRELTNQVSVELGIGPICAEKWGIL